VDREVSEAAGDPTNSSSPSFRESQNGQPCIQTDASGPKGIPVWVLGQWMVGLPEDRSWRSGTNSIAVTFRGDPTTNLSATLEFGANLLCSTPR
jgi:hypothetical protein